MAGEGQLPSHLDPLQQRAVETPGHCVVVACPGSGKTRVLAARAARLLSQNERGRVCAVTFTQDAARSLKARVIEATHGAHDARLAVGTFHSLAFHQIKRAQRPAHAPKLLSEGHQRMLLKRCYNEVRPRGLTFTETVKQVERHKAQPAGQVMQSGPLRTIYELYQGQLRAEGAMDFADVLLRATQDMTHKIIKPLPVRWMLVDEAQDMDAVQLEWVLQHAFAGIDTTLVGDDDQSLYSFRHALGYSGMQQFNLAVRAQELHLDTNYRCPRVIVQHATQLIRCNQTRSPKRIEAARQTIGTVVVTSAESRTAECADAAENIVKHASGTWAILARTNTLLDDAETALLRADIPYHRVKSTNIWNTTLGELFIGFLRAIMFDSWTEYANFLVYAGLPPKIVNAASRSSQQSIIERLRMIQSAVTSTWAGEQCVDLARSFAALRADFHHHKTMPVITAAYHSLDLYTPQEQKKKLAMLANTIQNLHGTLSARMETVEKWRRQAGSGDGVQLASLHASKGLEFDNVWMMGCEAGTLPFTDCDIEEERRLFYVGMTRAKEKLWCSYASEEGAPSQFLADAGLAAVAPLATFQTPPSARNSDPPSAIRTLALKTVE